MLSSDTSPRDVYTVDLAAGDSNRLTTALNPAIDEADLVASEVIRYPSFDDLEIPAIQYRPKAASASHKVPPLVWVHDRPGGPHRPGSSPTIPPPVTTSHPVPATHNPAPPPQ